MPRLLLIIATLLSIAATAQQNISVKSFRTLAKDMDARINHPVKDQNGDVAALIKIVTTETGFKFEAGSLGITKVEKKTGEYWVYVPYGSRKITIKHDQLGVLRNYVYPEAIKKATVYEMILTTGKVVTTVEDAKIPTQYLIITSEPTGATVIIDEQQVGTTTFQRKYKEGEYNYRVKLPKYHPSAGKVTLKDEKKRLDLKLKPNFGSINVTSSPESGMQIYLDGENTGKSTPAIITEVSSGEHKIQLRDKWYQARTLKIEVSDEDTANADFNLKKAFANLSVITESDADILIDGEKKGSGKWEGRLLSGYYNLKIKKDKYKSEEKQIEITAGNDKELNFNLEGKTGSLDVVTDPIEAEIFIDDKSYGLSPKTVNDLLIGEYKLELKKEGYATLRKNIQLKENESLEINEKLSSGREINISCNPEGTSLYLDGEFIGESPVRTKISYGKHKLKAVSGILENEKNIEITENSNTYITINIKKQITINSSPPDGKVFIDDNYKGLTPLTIEIADKPVDIKIMKDGFKEINDHLSKLPKNGELEYNFKEIKVINGYCFDFQYGLSPSYSTSALGFGMSIFINQFYISGSIGIPGSPNSFNEEIDPSHQSISVNDIESYQSVGRNYLKADSYGSTNLDEDLNYNSTLSLKVGYQLISPFPMFLYAGYGARKTNIYEYVYQAKHDYLNQNQYYSTELKEGDYFTPAEAHIDAYNSFIVGIDIPLFETIMIGAEYWYNTETEHTIYLKAGLIINNEKMKRLQTK